MPIAAWLNHYLVTQVRSAGEPLEVFRFFRFNASTFQRFDAARYQLPRGEAVARAKGYTGPLPCRCKHTAASVSVHPESTTSSTNKTGIRSRVGRGPDAVVTCWANRRNIRVKPLSAS